MGKSDQPAPFKNQRLLLRSAVAMLGLAAAIFGYQWIRSVGQDPDILPGDSAGMLAAIQFEGEGSRVVVFDSKGNKIEVPGWSSGKTDEQPVWRPDGQRLFFASNREENTFHIFRWRPGASEAERRSVGTRSKGTPWFGPIGYPNVNDTALITSGGFVLEYSPRDGSTRQVLPPPSDGATASGEEGGTGDQFSVLYERIGESFIEARWGADRNFLVASMRREDGEVLMIQDFRLDAEGRVKPPVPVFAGEKIHFDVSPSGTVMASITGFRWTDPDSIPEQFVKNGIATRPFDNGLVLVDPNDVRKSRIVLALKSADEFPIQPVFSADGTKVALIVGKLGAGEQFEPTGLAVISGDGNADSLTGLVREPIYEPSWGNDSSNIYYARRVGEDRAIFRYNIATNTESRVTQGPGEFGFPILSPQAGPQ